MPVRHSILLEEIGNALAIAQVRFKERSTDKPADRKRSLIGYLGL